MSTAAPRNRRYDDERLERIEAQIAGVLKSVGQIRSSLGDRFTTLMFDLDTRYMPRQEMETVYVPRKEHQANAARRRTWREQLPLIIFAGVSSVTNIVLVLHTVLG